MATEKYGVYAQLVKSLANTPVSTDTNVIFIGASPSGDLNKAHLITSMSDYAEKLGGAPGDGYNLSEAAVAAFSVAGINQVYMIPVSNSTEFDADDYIGDASSFTGVHAVEKLFMDSPTATNILCVPSVTDGSVIAELMTVAKKANGHWDSFVMVDQNIPSENITDGVLINAEVTKNVSDEQAVQCLGKIKTTGNQWVSLAAVRACLQAVSDATRGVPYRSGGNLYIPNMVSWGGEYNTLSLACSVTLDNHLYKPRFTITQEGYTDYSGPLYCTVHKHSQQGEADYEGYVTFTNGSGLMESAPYLGSETSLELSNPTASLRDTQPVIISESMGTQLSADGVCSVINYGGGNWHTWGDHTSAFTAGNVSDERARYDSNIRMLIMLTNRFQLKYRFSVDDPMTLTMRNDVIQEENDYLAYLKSIGAIIGDATCSFKADDNPVDKIALGQFVWSIESTITPPLKYAQLNVAYSSAGLSVYYE